MTIENSTIKALIEEQSFGTLYSKSLWGLLQHKKWWINDKLSDLEWSISELAPQSILMVGWCIVIAIHNWALVWMQTGQLLLTANKSFWQAILQFIFFSIFVLATIIKVTWSRKYQNPTQSSLTRNCWVTIEYKTRILEFNTTSQLVYHFLLLEHNTQRDLE